MPPLCYTSRLSSYQSSFGFHLSTLGCGEECTIECVARMTYDMRHTHTAWHRMERHTIRMAMCALHHTLSMPRCPRDTWRCALRTGRTGTRDSPDFQRWTCDPTILEQNRCHLAFTSTRSCTSHRVHTDTCITPRITCSRRMLGHRRRGACINACTDLQPAT